MDLHVLWFILLGVLLSGYAILDGFDLGIGILHLAGRNDRERRLQINSIGPHWDGNEVWLITFGGALFAAFPDAYASIFSGFYTAFMMLLFALIFRAISIEFRNKRNSLAWMRFWDCSFSAASALAVLLFGVAAGNVLAGVPMNANGEFTGSFFDLLKPYPILTGLLAVALAAMHGAVYLYLKTESELHELARRWIWRSFGLALFFFILAAVFTFTAIPQTAGNFQKHPLLWAIVAIIILAFANIPRAIYRERPFYAFLSSSLIILAMIFLFSFSLYPNLVISSASPAYNLTIYNAASSNQTLFIMAIIAAIGMPIVLIYTSVIYWIFRGKSQI